MKLSIIVPIYNALDDVKLLFNSIIANVDLHLNELILVNDYSNSETTEFLESFVREHPKIKLLRNSENLGFPKTCNYGMKNASGDIIVLLNSDTIIPQKFCEKIIECFNSDENIGLASPLRTNGGQYSLDMPDNFDVDRMNVLLEKKHKKVYPLIPSAEGLCFCIRREVIEQQGYLDEIFGRGYHEEVDYAYRANENGWKNVLIDNLFIYHKCHASFGSAERAKLIKQNDKIFYERWKDYKGKWCKKHSWENPIYKIKADIFWLYRFQRLLFFKREKLGDKFKYTIMFLGIVLSFKFPRAEQSGGGHS